jgi:type VI secretion system protein ImpC
MSAAERQAQQAQATEAAAEGSLLESAIAATKQTERDARSGTVEDAGGRGHAGHGHLEQGRDADDQGGDRGDRQSGLEQLSAVMHTPAFQQLEGTWRGLHYLVMNSETSTQLKLKVLNAGKREVFKDLDKAVEFDQSQLFKKLYENEFGTPGGEPYGALIGDFEFTNHPEDIDLLSKISNVAAAAFCPFIASASPALCGFDNWTELTKPARHGEDLRHGRVHQVAFVPRQRGFAVRHVDDAAGAGASAPTGPTPSRWTSSISRRWNWVRASRRSIAVPHDQYCWMNASFVLGTG